MLGKKNFFRNSISRKLVPEPAYSGTVSITAVPTHIAVANNDIQIAVDSNLRTGKKVFVSLTGLTTDYANINVEATVDAQGNANISVPVKLSTWANIESAISVSVTREGGIEIGSATGNVHSDAHGLSLPRTANTTNFDIGTGEARIEGLQNKFVNQQISFNPPTGNALIDYVVVGSGGAGGGSFSVAGCGGAGGVLEQFNYDLYDFFAGNVTVDSDVMFMNAGDTNTSQGVAGTGEDTLFTWSGDRNVLPFDTVQANVAYAFGGGNGGFQTSIDGSDGGSGGGATRFSGTQGSGGTGTAGQGFDGAGAPTVVTFGGGGGAGGAAFYQSGGNPKSSDITGASVEYGRGGSRDGGDGDDFTGDGGGNQGDGGAGTFIIRQHGDYTTNIILD